MSAFRLSASPVLLERSAELEDGADDGEGEEADENEDAHQHAAREDLGEHRELVGDVLLIVGGDFLEARHDVAGVFADRELVEDDRGKAVRALERAGEVFAFDDSVGGFVERAAVDDVANLASGHLEGFDGGDAVFEEHGERLADGEDGLADEEGAGERELEQPAVGDLAAGGGRAPAPECDGAEDERAEYEDAVVQREVREADEDARGGGEFPAERCQENLETREEEEEEEENDAAGDEEHEHRIRHRGEELAAEFALFGEMRDEATEDVVKAAGGFAGLDEIDRGVVENFREIAHRAGERSAFAEAFPEAGAEDFEFGFLKALSEEAEAFTSGESTGDEVFERLEKREAFGAREFFGGAGA